MCIRDRAEAEALLYAIAPFQEQCRRELGTTFAFPSDEFFLHVRFGEGSFAPVEDAAIRAAVERALTLPKSVSYTHLTTAPASTAPT